MFSSRESFASAHQGRDPAERNREQVGFLPVKVVNSNRIARYYIRGRQVLGIDSGDQLGTRCSRFPLVRTFSVASPDLPCSPGLGASAQG